MGQASVHVDAPPETVWAAVSDVTRMGEWSPECTGGEWLDGATGPRAGARFKGTNRSGVFRWSTTPTVVAAEPGREFAFAIAVRGIERTRWTYRFEAEGEGTRLTESFEMVNDEPALFAWAQRYLMRIADRRADLERGMEATLSRIKAAVESGAGTVSAP